MAGDPSTVELLVTFGIPGALALLGVWLGKVWERRGGTASWLRGERLRAYAQMLDTAHAHWAQAALCYVNTAELTGEMADELDRLKFQLANDFSRLSLLGPASVTKAAAAFLDANLLLSEFVATRGLDNSTLFNETEPGVAIQGAHEEFASAAQRALGVQP